MHPQIEKKLINRFLFDIKKACIRYNLTPSKFKIYVYTDKIIVEHMGLRVGDTDTGYYFLYNDLYFIIEKWGSFGWYYKCEQDIFIKQIPIKERVVCKLMGEKEKRHMITKLRSVHKPTKTIEPKKGKGSKYHRSKEKKIVRDLIILDDVLA